MSWLFHEGEDASPGGLIVDRLLDESPPRQAVLDSYIGSPMYGFIQEHELALLAVGGLVLWYLGWGRRSGGRWMRAYRVKPPLERLLVWMLATTSIIHLALVFGHEPSGYTVLYLGGALAPWLVLRRLLSDGSWRRWAVVVLVGLLVGYAVTLMGGEAPDQVGILAKLVELAALAIVVQPRQDSRVRRVGASSVVVSLTVFTALAAWIGGFTSGEGGHHLGETPPPGVLLPDGIDRPATPEEQHAADELFEATERAIAKYRDPDVAAADGFAVAGMSGTDFHADNPRYHNDGRILDPTRPETLVYAVSEAGEPELLGAMFQMDDIGDAGPAVGGPLTVWHAHDHICLTVPIAIGGLTSPYGVCPLGSISIPVTNEMLHVWVLPGVEDKFGDIDDEWLASYLENL